MAFDVRQLQPGDHLLYTGTGLISWAIKTKTWSPYSHIEIYIGNGRSLASRNGIGVGNYPLRTEDLGLILRPNRHFDLDKGLAWFKSVDGQGYDWLGLFAFFFAKWNSDPDVMFCSEFALRLDRAMQLPSFPAATDADQTSPGMYANSLAFDQIQVT